MFHLFLAALAGAAPAVQSPVVFKDWAVGCDNGRYCEAESLDPPDRTANIEINFALSPDPRISPFIDIFINVHSDELGNKLAIDGRMLSPELQSDEPLLSLNDDPELVRSLLSGKEFQLLDKNGRKIGFASLAGLSAALRYVDERQKRAGTKAALVAKGPLPISRVPAEPKYPKVDPLPGPPYGAETAAPPRKLLAAKHKQICGTDWDSDANPADVQRFDSRHSLLVLTLPCGFGSYNPASIILVDRDGQAEWTEPKFDVGDIFSPCCEKMNARVAEGAHWDDLRDERGSVFDRAAAGGWFWLGFPLVDWAACDVAGDARLDEALLPRTPGLTLAVRATLAPVDPP